MAGKYFEDLEVGMHFKHSAGRTVTEMDNVLFSALTMNTQPLHVNEEFAANTEFGQRIVNGIFTLGLVVGGAEDRGEPLLSLIRPMQVGVHRGCGMVSA